MSIAFSDKEAFLPCCHLHKQRFRLSICVKLQAAAVGAIEGKECVILVHVTRIKERAAVRLNALVNAACDVLGFYSEWLPSPLVLRFTLTAFSGGVRHISSHNKRKPHSETRA